MGTNQPSAHDRRRSAGPSDAAPAPPITDQHSQELFVRNYDMERTYHLQVTVARTGADERLEREYTLHPGQVITECNGLAAGEYELRVEIDHTATEQPCAIGPGPDETALVEVGNGTVSISQGLY